MLNFQKCDEITHFQGSARTGYTFTYVRPLHCYLLFGGANNDSDVYIYNINKTSWCIQPTGGVKKAPSRKYHAAAFVESVFSLLINGGQDDHGRCLEDYYALSIKDWKWRKLIVVKSPHPRQRHCLYPRSEKQLIMYGGISHYNQPTNDIWIFKIQFEKQSKQQNINIESIKIQPKGRSPMGKITAESTYYKNQQLYVGNYDEQEDFLRLFCFDFKSCEWKNLQFAIRCQKIKIFRTIRGNQNQGFSFYIVDKKKSSSSNFFYYDISSNKFTKLSTETDFVHNCDEITGQGNESQILCLRQGKRIFTVKYDIQEISQPKGNLEEYSIAIKQQQVLSVQLMKKNAQLEELYREMQIYLTQLFKQYNRYEEDQVIQSQRIKHIQDCHRLKKEYGKLDMIFENINEQIRALRNELGTINEDFERCMQTQFDQQA